MKKYSSIFTGVALSLAFFVAAGTASAQETTMKSIGSDIKRATKVYDTGKKVGKKTYRVGQTAGDKVWDGSKWVAKKSYKGGKWVGGKSVKGSKWAYRKTKTAVTGTPKP